MKKSPGLNRVEVFFHSHYVENDKKIFWSLKSTLYLIITFFVIIHGFEHGEVFQRICEVEGACSSERCGIYHISNLYRVYSLLQEETEEECKDLVEDGDYLVQ